MNNLTRTLILCSVLVLTACAEDDPLQFITEGQALFEAGDMESAGVQFKNALQINPKLADAYYGLALIAEKKIAWQTEKKYLQEVIAIDAKHVGAHVKLGFLLIAQPDKAKKQATIALKLDPENNGAILLQSRIQYEAGSYKEAIEGAEQVLAKDPDKMEAYWLKAQALRAEKKYDLALATILSGLAKKPDNIDLGLLKVKIYIEQQRISEAFLAYDELIALHPKDKKIRLAKIDTLLQIGKPEPIKKELRQAISDFNDADELKTILIDFLLRKGQIEPAQKQLETFLAADVQNIKLKARLARVYLQQKKTESAKKLLLEIILADPKGQKGLSAKLLMAKIAMAEKAPEKAVKLVEEIIATDNANTAALKYRATIRLNKKNFDGAISDLRIILRDQPNDEQSLVMMAQIYQLKGQPEVAESNWRKALEANPANINALMPLVAKRIKSGNATDAEGLINKALKVRPNNSALVKMLVETKVTERDWKGAEDILKKLPQNNGFTQMLTAQLLNSEKKYLEAIKVYQALLAKTPKANKALTGLYRSYLAAGQSEQLLNYLKSFEQQYPENIQVKLLLGQIYGLKKQWTHAEQIFKQVLKLDSKSVKAYFLLNSIYMEQGVKTERLALLKQGLKKIPDNPQLLIEQAAYYEADNAYDKAKNIYEQIMAKNPDIPLVINNLAALILDQKTDSASIKKALELAERIKSIKNPYFQDTYAWALCKSGDYKNAITILKKVAAVLPNNQDIKQHLDNVQKTACSLKVVAKE